MVAWSEPADDTSVAMVARAALGGPGGDFNEPVDLGTGLVVDSAARSDGTTMVTWAGGPPGASAQQPRHVMAALHRSGAAGFDSAETVSADEEGIFRAVSGFGDRSGRPTVAWEASVPMGDPGATTMRFATRVAP
jgi:hypothetical protein